MKQCSIDHYRVLNIAFPDGRYGLSGKTTDYIVFEAMFLPGLRMLIPQRAQWNGGVLQGQRFISIFTDGSKLGAGVFCRELRLELPFQLDDDCSMFQAKIFAILKAIEAIAGGPASDSESYVIFVESWFNASAMRLGR